MTRSHRIIAFSLIAALLLAGFAIGRLTKSTDTVAAEETHPVAASVNPQSTSQPVSEAAAGKDSKFYLSDYKVGYNEGFKAGREGQDGTFPDTARTGYNDGYKQGYNDALQNQAQTNAEPEATTAPTVRRPRVYYRSGGRTVVYRTVAQRRHSNWLRNTLTIAAPAAIGAGIGALVGGKKGAGVGALLGGGGGAFYMLKKHRY